MYGYKKYCFFFVLRLKDRFFMCATYIFFCMSFFTRKKKVNINVSVNMRSLLIPVAHSVGLNVNVLPSQAVKQRDKPFKCLKCDGAVHLRCKSSRNQAHFVHTKESAHVCDGINETIIHLAAKLIIASYKHDIVLAHKCSCCKLLSGCIQHLLPNEYCRNTEVPVGPFVVDVAFLNEKQNITTIVEIKHTHAVDKTKWEYLLSVTSNVYELNANDVLTAFKETDNKLSLQYTNIWLCESCQIKMCAICVECDQKFESKNIQVKSMV